MEGKSVSIRLQDFEFDDHTLFKAAIMGCKYRSEEQSETFQFKDEKKLFVDITCVTNMGKGTRNNESLKTYIFPFFNATVPILKEASLSNSSLPPVQIFLRQEVLNDLIIGNNLKR